MQGLPPLDIGKWDNKGGAAPGTETHGAPAAPCQRTHLSDGKGQRAIHACRVLTVKHTPAAEAGHAKAG